MATITSNGTGGGLWSATATWNGGAVPVDDDTVVIASGDTVTYNADWSSDVTYPNGINGMTITGTLKVSTSTSSYMKMKAATQIAGAGTFNIGESGAGAIPFAVKFTLTGGANWYVNGSGGLTMTVYGTEPTNKYVKLSALEASGQTELSVDTDITGDIWADGDTLRIVGGTNNVGNYGSSDHTIAVGGRASGAITVTPALSDNRVAGSYIVLTQRNVRILMGTSTTNNYVIYKFGAGKLTIGSGYFSTEANSKSIFNSNSESFYATITGGVYYAYFFSHNFINSSVSDAIILGGSRFFSNYSKNNIVNNCLILGHSDYAICDGGNIFKNCVFAFLPVVSAQGWNIFDGCAIKNTALGAGNALYSTPGLLFTNCTFENNGYHSYTSSAIFYNCYFGNSSSDITYASSAAGSFGYAESIDHQQSVGAYKRWTLGGTIASQVSVLPSGYSLAYIHPLASAIYYSHFPVRFIVPAGETVSVEVQLRKDASMTYLPRAYLMNSIENPLVDPTQAEDSFTMTDSTDTWESDTFTIDNSAGTTDKSYTLWFVGKNASGNVYSAYNITTAGGGGGGLLTNPGMSGGMRG